MNPKIRVTLVEDHPEYRDVVELALRKEEDIELISEFGTAERALRSLQNISSTKMPDIILLDLNLPGMSGLESIPHFNKIVPNAKLIILTQSDSEADILQAITLGTSGYLLKSSTARSIKDGIRSVYTGGSSLDNKLAGFILQTLKQALPHDTPTGPQLSNRELEVLSLLADGLVKKEIAAQLNIGASTVVTHVNHIYKKLNATNAPAAINQAHLRGIFQNKE